MIELIVVIAIIGILSGVAVPAYAGYVKKAKEEVCRVNCLQVEKMYEMYLDSEGIEHMDVVFEVFLKEYVKDLCPEHGVLIYVDGKIRYSEHSEEDEVSFL